MPCSQKFQVIIMPQTVSQNPKSHVASNSEQTIRAQKLYTTDITLYSTISIGSLASGLVRNSVSFSFVYGGSSLARNIVLVIIDL
jgi:hypothetical protein